jgi:ketosteroid isomerase-like protein
VARCAPAVAAGGERTDAARQRQALPWVRIDKAYRFETGRMADSKSTTDESRMRKLPGAFCEAFRAKDIEGVMPVFALDVVSFDVGAPLQCVGADTLRKDWEQTFSAYETPSAYDSGQLHITTVGDSVAFAHSLNHMSATSIQGQKTERWLRWTACWRENKDGPWLITQEHVSVPIDVKSGKALFDADPAPD